ncbi:hypothetical protein DBV05_g12666 [Lasiodiplodia theobromae]|uniref:Uncharacterized protein n=1 Tax=Lasiodiplodia theobromae TaxID=45133 RepID=A0A5N5CTJ1_9PEZI|nr:hypothetical protein DBV05_g12666 [Lasiodiplodia theobromae]
MKESVPDGLNDDWSLLTTLTVAVVQTVEGPVPLGQHLARTQHLLVLHDDVTIIRAGPVSLFYADRDFRRNNHGVSAFYDNIWLAPRLHIDNENGLIEPSCDIFDPPMFRSEMFNRGVMLDDPPSRFSGLARVVLAWCYAGQDSLHRLHRRQGPIPGVSLASLAIFHSTRVRGFTLLKG